jgi:hypothetical protein
MKKTPNILPTYYKSLGTKIFRDTTALPFADGGPLNDRNIKGDLLPSVYASALGRYYSNGGKFLTAGGEFHKIYKNPEGDIIVNHPKEDKGKWDTINLTEKSGANTISEGVDATKQWHAENPNSYANGGMLKRADGSYSKRGLWDNIRANAGSGKEPTKDMLAQERKINNNYAEGGQLGPGDCGPGLRWDEATQSCVPATIIVEDENDPRYLEYLERQRLYEYSQLPNHVVKQMIVSDLAKNYIAKAEEPFNAKEEAEFYTKNFDDPEYTNDLVGPFGSAASKRTLTPEEFAAWKQSIPREALMGEYAAGKLADLTSKYPPSKYEIRESEIDTPWNYHIQQTDDQKKWTSPKTNFLEDKINREALRKVYPNLSDEQIDKWVIESRTQPSYISNTIDPRTNSSEWILGPGQMETISYEEGNSESTFVPKKFPEFNPPPTFTDPDTKVKGYYPEYMAETFGKNYTYLPIWDAPIPVEIETPPVVPTAKEAPVEEFTGPQYNTPGYKMSLPSYYLAHHNSSQLIPHARLTRSIQDNVVTRPGAKLVQKITGYDPAAIEGYYNEEGEFVPGEIARAQEEGRRIKFDGLSNIKDLKAQREYNAAFNEYEKAQQENSNTEQYIEKKTYADGGQLGPGDPPNWKHPNLSPERIAALKALHGDNIFGNVNPNDLLLYDLNKDLVDNAIEFKSFLDPTAKVSNKYVDESLTKDLKIRMSKQGYGLDTKTGNYFKIPDEVLKAIQEPEDDFIPIGPPGRIDIPKRDIIRFDNSTTPAPEYDAPGYYRDYPAITWQHHNSNQLIPHARPRLTEVRVPGLGAAVVQKITGYNKPAVEGYEDEEGNWIPGEIEKAEQEGRRINFQGANSLKDRKAQEEYNAAFDAYEEDQKVRKLYGQLAKNMFLPAAQHANGGQLKPDYSLPEDSFQQGGRGLKNSVYASSMGQYPANYAEGGAMNQYPDGGSIYTYAKRPGSYYQKDSAGNWFISNKGTGGQYVPIDDPSGQRTAALNKGAVVTMANPTPDKYSKVTPSYNKSGMVQSVAGRTEAERQPVQDEIAGQQFAQNMERDYAEATKNQLPQHEQPLVPQDWMWSIPTGLKTVGQLAALRIPYTGMTLGTAANTAGAIHGATQIPERVQDWQDVSAGNKTWQEALIKSMGTGLELGTGALEIGKGINMYKFNPTGTSLAGGEASRIIQPGVITNPTTGLKQYGNTTLMDYVNLPVKRSLNSSYADASLLPEDQIPYLLPKEELVKRYPWQYMSKDQEILESFKPNLKVPQRPYEIPASHTTQEDIMARALGKPLPTRVSKASLEPKIYYDLNGNVIKKPQ